MSAIKTWAENNLPAVKLQRFRDEVLPMLLGLSQSRAYTIYYNGTTNADYLFKISFYLDCSIDDLYEFPEAEKRSLSAFKNLVQL